MTVSKKYASRRASKLFYRKVSILAIVIQFISIVYGWVVYGIENSDDYCYENSKEFQKNMKITLIFMSIQMLHNTIFTILTVKSLYYPLKRRYNAEYQRPNLVYESSDDVDDRTIQ